MKIDYLRVNYDEERWALLDKLRARAITLMEALKEFNIDSIVHGSIARGDVTPKSDIDVFIPLNIPSYKIELALESAGIKLRRRFIIQATPLYAIKGQLEIEERETISFPLVKFKPREMEFYQFGGCLNLHGLRTKKRVPGVDKRLMMIEPTHEGHKEWNIVGKEELVAKCLNISVDTVRERVQVLSRRRKVGRTGIFLKRELFDESFEAKLRELAKEVPIIKKRIV